MVAVGLWLPSVAVTIAEGELVAVSVPVTAAKVALLCPVVTVTLDGTLSAALLLVTETTRFEVAAGFRERVHVVEAFEPIEEGAQLTDVSVGAGGSWSVTVAVGLWLPSVAVTIADGELVEINVPVVAEKVALLFPDNTVTLEGTLSAALLLLTEIAVLEVTAGFTETVHVVEAFEPIEEGAQLTEVNEVATGI